MGIYSSPEQDRRDEAAKKEADQFRQKCLAPATQKQTPPAKTPKK